MFINLIHPSIQFTKEVEQLKTLPFLDLQIKRKENGTFSFSIYRKPTNTGNYLKFDSYHPLAHKRAVAKSLIDRANNLCDEQNLMGEL